MVWADVELDFIEALPHVGGKFVILIVVDPIFTSAFWRVLMRLMGIKLHMTSAFHPQLDG